MLTDIEHELLDELLSNIEQVLFVRDAFDKDLKVFYCRNICID